MTVAAAVPSLTQRRVVACPEYGRIQVDPAEVLRADGRLALAPGVLDRYVRADFKDSEVRLFALGVTGLFPLTDAITVQVRPRFPLHNLTHMVSTCGYVPTALSALREYRPTGTSDDWLLEVMADSLLAGLDAIAANGLLRAYRRRAEVSAYPHGRIDVTNTVLRQAARGVRHRADYSWFERTVDNPPNRCLKSAVTHLYRRYVDAPRRSGTQARIERLGDALHLLRNVTTETRPTTLSDAEVRGSRLLPGARAYYRPVLDLAVAILTGRGISLDAPGSSVSLPSLLVKTDDLFEDYVRLSLQRAFNLDDVVRVLDGNVDPGKVPLYEEQPKPTHHRLPPHVSLSGGTENAEPDLVFRAADGSHPLVADVKYTNVKRHADRSEVEQVVLYGVRYRSPVVMTIHPRRADSTKGLHLSGHIGSLIIMQYRVDLGAEDLEGEMRDLAQSIRVLISALAAAE